MVLNQKIINYIEFTDIPKTINSNLIITDLEKVIYNLNYDSEQNYKFNKLSTRIDELIVRWQTYDICENSFFISNDDSLKITENDIEKHSAIMIFPIYSCDKMEGLAVILETMEIIYYPVQKLIIQLENGL